MKSTKEKSDEKVKALLDRATNGVRDFLEGDKYKAYLRTMSQFHQYSARNCLLILMERPDATRVAGYAAWQKKFNRQVQRGEKGIQIVGYSTRTVKEEKERRDQNGNFVYDENGNIVVDVQIKKVPKFVPMYVWDVKQTDGEPLPSLTTKLEQTVDNYKMLLDSIKDSSDFEFAFEDIPNGANGYCNHEHKRIVIQQGMPEAQTVKTAVHELAHSIMHDGTASTDRHTKEVQAESVAFVVCEHYGIDTSDYTFPYLASWSKTAELKELQGSMDAIQNAANELITKIDKRFSELKDEHLQTKAQELTPQQPEYKKPDKESREAKLHMLWSKENPSDPSTQLWRKDLTSAEVKLVFGWDIGATEITEDTPICYFPETAEEKKSPIPVPSATQIGYKVFPLSDDKAAHDYQAKTGWNIYKLIDHDGTNEDSWIVYRSIEDLPDVLRRYVQENTTYTIYQLKPECRDNLFRSYSETPEIRPEDYVPIWTDTYPDGWSLEGLYTKFNIDLPDDFKGHSLSVSDIVVIQRGNNVTAHFVDTIGYRDLPDFARFLQQAQKLEDALREEMLDTVRYDGEPDLDKEPARPTMQDRMAAAQAEADRRNSERAELKKQQQVLQKS